MATGFVCDSPLAETKAKQEVGESVGTRVLPMLHISPKDISHLVRNGGLKRSVQACLSLHLHRPSLKMAQRGRCQGLVH